MRQICVWTKHDFWREHKAGSFLTSQQQRNGEASLQLQENTRAKDLRVRLRISCVEVSQEVKPNLCSVVPELLGEQCAALSTRSASELPSEKTCWSSLVT